MYYLKPAALFDGEALRTDQALLVENSVVVRCIAHVDIPAKASVEATDDIIAPGLFDIQVNGGGGVMLNNNPSPAGVLQIAKAHNSVGTSYLLPTVITDRFEVMEKAAFAVIESIGQSGVLGIHIEGPHINPRHKGTHNPHYIRPFDARTQGLLETLRAHGIPVLLTLAPETVPEGVIARLSEMGVTVSAGHSAANADETQNALNQGLRCFTHLFNAMPGMTSRAPAITGAAINSTAWCGIIADGHHVHDAMVVLAFRARPKANRMILVSDAMPTIGGPDRFELYGETIYVKKGRLVNAAGSLAGAHTDLCSTVLRAIHQIGLPVAATLRTATTNPFEMMKLQPPGVIGQPLQCLARIPWAGTSSLPA